jgi:hypothetical protein
MGKKTGSGSGMNNPDYVSKELRNQFFGLKYLFVADPGTGMEKTCIRDGKHADPGSRINIPDPQHCPEQEFLNAALRPLHDFR